jgi:hypothetical protein
MPDRELFAPLCQLQLPSHCGPCSLSACLFILGTTATQRQLARAAGRPMQVFAHGIDEEGLRRAAEAYGVASEFLLAEERRKGREFATRLRRHLSAGNPAIMLVDHFEHWVAVIGYLKHRRRFIVVDPKDETSVSRLWPEQTLIRRGWNVNATPGVGEPDQFFAILLARADGGPPRWQVSEAWLRLCERGSDDTAEGMANDLAEVAQLASPGEEGISDGPYLAELIEEYRERILDSIIHWAQGNGMRDRGDLRTFFGDYQIVASATGIRVAKRCDRPYLVAQLTALLCSYWWGARF